MEKLVRLPKVREEAVGVAAEEKDGEKEGVWVNEVS
jgi:hypothetical protein